MTVTLCERSWLAPDQCAHCRGEDDRDVPELGPVTRTLLHVPSDPEHMTLYEARRPARCDSCDRTIQRGERMGHDAATGRNACSECLT